MILLLALLSGLIAAPAAAEGGAAAQLDRILERSGRGAGPEEQAVNARFEESLAAAAPSPLTLNPSPARGRGEGEGKGRGKGEGGVLAEKARMFEERTRDEHRPWLGLILSRRVHPDGSLRQYDNFGDCLIWTGNYVASQAYRYAVTGEEEALQGMEESLWGLHALHEATGNPGHVARVLVPADYGAQVGFKAGGNRHDAKGKWAGWVWEGDNSLDSYDGYLFGIAAAWPHIRDPLLREAIREDMLQVGLHVIRNNMRIVGEDTFLDFRPTFYYQNHWPKALRGLPVPPWRDGNAVHGLHTMKVAAMVTQDPRLEAYYRQEMILNHELDQKIKDAPSLTELIGKYEKALTAAGRAWSGEAVVASPHSLRSDIGLNLQHMAMHDLVRLEEDPQIRRTYEDAYKRHHRPAAGDGNTYWNFLYASQIPDGHSGIGAGVDSLRRYPTRRVLGQIRNSGDPAFPKFKGLHGETAFPARWYTTDPLPFEKRAMPAAFPWQHNPYELDGGAESDDQGSGTGYLIAYWLGRYHGFITESQ